MLPSEILILLAVIVSGKYGKRLLSGSLDISGEYVGYFYNSLVNRGYLKRHGPDSYHLAPAGRQLVLGLLKNNPAAPHDIINQLRSFGIKLKTEQTHEIEKLEREAIGVN